MQELCEIPNAIARTVETARRPNEACVSPPGLGGAPVALSPAAPAENPNDVDPSRIRTSRNPLDAARSPRVAGGSQLTKTLDGTVPTEMPSPNYCTALCMQTKVWTIPEIYYHSLTIPNRH